MSCSPNPGKERSRSRSPIKMRSPEQEPVIEIEETTEEQTTQKLSTIPEQTTTPTTLTVPNESPEVVEKKNNESTKLHKSIKDEFDDTFHEELLRLEESIKEETSMIDEVLNDEIDETLPQKRQKFNESPFSKPFKTQVQSVIHLSNLPLDWDLHQVRHFLELHTTLTPDITTVFIVMRKNRQGQGKKGECDLRLYKIEDSLIMYKDLINLKKKKEAFKDIIVSYKYPKHVLQNSVDQEMTQPAPKVLTQTKCRFPPVYLPHENPGDETYGISLSYLKSLGIKPPLTCKVFVKNLDTLVDEAKLREVFELAGEVKEVFLFHNRRPNETLKARITYDHPVEVVQAISMFNNQFLYNSQMRLEMDLSHWRKGRMLPSGLRGVGKGLGPSGLPMKGVRTIAELRPIKKMLQELTTKKTSATPPDTTPSNNPIGPNIKENNQNYVTNALNPLNPQNLLLGLLGAQGLIQQGNVNDLVSMLTNMQNQNIPTTTQIFQNTNPLYNVAQASASNVTPTPSVQNAFNIDSGWSKQMNQNFNQNAAGLNQNAAGYNQNASGHNQNATGYHQNAAGYNQNATGYNQNATGYNQNATSFDQTVTQNRNEWTTSPEPQTRQSRFSGEPVLYNFNQTNFDSKRKDNTTAANGSSNKTPNKFEKKKETAASSDLLVFNNLPSSVTVQALNMKMREVGELMFGEMTGQGRAIVRFKHSHDAERCIKLFNRSKVDGQIIDVHDALKRLKILVLSRHLANLKNFFI